MKKFEKMSLIITLIAVMMVVPVVQGCSSDSTISGDNATSVEGANSSAKDQFWNIGSSSSGTFYYYASAVGEVLTPKIEGLTLSGEGTNGSIENCRRVSSGELALGLTGPSNLIDEINVGNVSADDVRLICMTINNPWIIAARPGLGTELSEVFISGVKCGIGEPGTALQVWSKQIASVCDVDIDDINKFEISQAEEVDAMLDGKIDMGLFGPTSHVTNLATSLKGGVVVLNWTEKQIEDLAKMDPFIVPYTLPGGTYEGTPNDILTPTFNIALIGREDLDENLVYEMVKALMSSSEEIGKIYPIGGGVSHDSALNAYQAFVDAGVQLHPGAERYFKEVGLL